MPDEKTPSQPRSKSTLGSAANAKPHQMRAMAATAPAHRAPALSCARICSAAKAATDKPRRRQKRDQGVLQPGWRISRRHYANAVLSHSL